MSDLNVPRTYTIAAEMADEFERAVKKYGFPEFHSYHEGYAVIKEELDELWEEVKKYPKQNNENLRKEAIQIGAMAIRFVYDLIQKEGEK
ncbi:MAG: hypothetical protein WC554_02880 [Clostridia bacterium]